jgi:tetratricopeptide (TPR) repeat protein
LSPRARIRLIVAVAAIAAAGTVAGVVYATRQTPAQPRALCRARPQAIVVPGVRSGHVAAVRAALAHPPKLAARLLEPLAQGSPRDAVVQFNDAAVLYCAGYVNEASQAFRQAKAAGRDTYYEVVADNLLHPQFFSPEGGGYPPFQYYGHDALLIQGQVAQRQFHQRTAERLWAKAARLHPRDADAQVAAGVGRFDEDDLSASFSRLGPLVTRFPRSQTVRFHLGLLLAWTGQRDLAVKEFRRAVALGPQTRFGKVAKVFLARLVTGGTKPTKR